MLKSALQVAMQCRHFPGVKARPRPRLLPALRSCGTLFLFLNFALLACAARVWAQDSATPSHEGTISGTVYAQDASHPASQVALSLKSHEAGVFRSILTDYDGHFEVRGLPPGVYEISIEEQGYDSFWITARLEGPSLKLELQLAAPPSLPSPNNPYAVSVRELKIPDNAHQEFIKGLERMAQKDQPGSLSHFTRAVKLFPGYFEAFYHEGVVETNLGHLENATEAFQKALDLSGGRYGRAVLAMGYIHYLKGMAAEAETIIRRGLVLDPNSADGYVVLGMTLLRLNRPDEAAKSAHEALSRNPNLANAYLVLADSCARKQNYREQLEALDAYLRLEPDGSVSQRVQEVREVAQRIVNRMSQQNVATNSQHP
jgi:tetratricopeptide (TPR) repeat protein